MGSDKRYRFGDIVFRIISPQNLKENECLETFRAEESEKEDYIYEICPIENAEQEVSVCTERIHNHIKVHILMSLIPKITIANLFSVAETAKLLPEKNEFILHVSYVLYQKKAILFCAPSGTGKSTQAHFWEKERGAVIVNEDRAVIFRKNGIYYAGGCWATGEAKTCLNCTAPIQQIILLLQGKRNGMVEMSVIEKFKWFMEQCSFENKKIENQNHIISLIFDLIEAVPVMGYECINDVSAVEELEKYL